MDWSLNSWTSIFYIIGGYHGDCWRRFFTWVNLVFALWSEGLYGIVVFHNPLIGILAATSVTAQGSHLLKNYWNLELESLDHLQNSNCQIFFCCSIGRWPFKKEWNAKGIQRKLKERPHLTTTSCWQQSFQEWLVFQVRLMRRWCSQCCPRIPTPTPLGDECLEYLESSTCDILWYPLVN